MNTAPPTPESTSAVVVEGLVKHFGETKAVDGVGFEVPKGTVTALLGPNGAGKTTTVRMLATLLRPDSGSASVAGQNVIEDPNAVRARIGVTGQDTAVDELLTGRENLVMIARLQRLDKKTSEDRAGELLRRFDLDAAADRKAETYSGGMRRRLDLAASMINEPEILFLDEPTTGLDPRSRIDMWSQIEELVERGTTVLLTTQYLDEADHLADDIIVIDRGKVIAHGTSDELKGEVGGQRLELKLADAGALEKAASTVSASGCEVVERNIEELTINIALTDGASQVATLIQRVEDAGTPIEEVFVHRPTLDDVFLSLTGQHVEDDDSAEDDR